MAVSHWGTDSHGAEADEGSNSVDCSLSVTGESATLPLTVDGTVAVVNEPDTVRNYAGIQLICSCHGFPYRAKPMVLSLVFST